MISSVSRTKNDIKIFKNKEVILIDNTLQGRGAKHFFTSGGELLNIVLIWNSNDVVGWIRPAEHDNVPGTKVPGTSRDYSGSTPRVHIEIDPLRPPVMSNYTWERGWWEGQYLILIRDCEGLPIPPRAPSSTTVCECVCVCVDILSCPSHSQSCFR